MADLVKFHWFGDNGGSQRCQNNFPVLTEFGNIGLKKCQLFCLTNGFPAEALCRHKKHELRFGKHQPGAGNCSQIHNVKLSMRSFEMDLKKTTKDQWICKQQIVRFMFLCLATCSWRPFWIAQDVSTSTGCIVIPHWRPVFQTVKDKACFIWIADNQI